jgi:hypothetical protein
MENPREISNFLERVPYLRRHRRQILGDRSLYSGTLLGWGSAPGAISIDLTAISINLSISYDEEGVVHPRG